jgi:hypothetical protein
MMIRRSLSRRKSAKDSPARFTVIGEQSGGAFAQIVDEMCQRLLIEVVKHVFEFFVARTPRSKSASICLTQCGDERITVLFADFTILISMAAIEPHILWHNDFLGSTGEGSDRPPATGDLQSAAVSTRSATIMQHAETPRKPTPCILAPLEAGPQERCARLLGGVLGSRPSRAGLLPRGRFRSRLAAKTERLRQLGTLCCIVRRDERMVALEVEGGAIFGRR